MSNQLTEPQAWRALAEQFALPANGYHYDKCLCWALDSLYFSQLASYRVRSRMKDRIRAHLTPDGGWAYEYESPEGYTQNDQSEESRQARSMAALWLALEAAEGE